MNAEKGQLVYDEARKLILENPKHAFDLERCGKCGMDHGRLEGKGEIENGAEWQLICQVCGARMLPITEDAMLRYYDVVCSILGYLRFEELGVFRV